MLDAAVLPPVWLDIPVQQPRYALHSRLLWVLLPAALPIAHSLSCLFQQMHSRQPDLLNEQHPCPHSSLLLLHA